jgi:hypothetical protein
VEYLKITYGLLCRYDADDEDEEDNDDNEDDDDSDDDFLLIPTALFACTEFTSREWHVLP